MVAKLDKSAVTCYSGFMVSSPNLHLHSALNQVNKVCTVVLHVSTHTHVKYVQWFHTSAHMHT